MAKAQFVCFQMSLQSNSVYSVPIHVHSNQACNEQETATEDHSLQTIPDLYFSKATKHVQCIIITITFVKSTIPVGPDSIFNLDLITSKQEVGKLYTTKEHSKDT